MCKCHLESVVYQATVTHTNKESRKEENETYIGMTGTTFKERYATHRSSFKLEHKISETELSKYIWSLKKQNIIYKVRWKILDRARTYSPVSKICQLCTLERYYLIRRTDLWSLNSNTEFGFHCKHKRFKLLSHLK